MKTRAAVVRPVVGERQAIPVLISATLFPEIMAQHGDVGGRIVARRHRKEVHLVPGDDLRFVVDIDSPTDYEFWNET